MKSTSSTNEKIEDRNGKILKFTGKPGDNWPRILEDFQSAMVRRGFGRYLRVDKDEPVPIVRNAFNTADFNNNNRASQFLQEWPASPQLKQFMELLF